MMDWQGRRKRRKKKKRIRKGLGREKARFNLLTKIKIKLKDLPNDNLKT